MPEYEQKFSGRDAGGRRLQLGVCDGRFVAIGSEIDGDGETEHDFGDALLFPGWIDAHVHFNEPGRAGWEGLGTGSRALAAGGGTVFFDMPLNSSPPVVTAEALLEKRALAERKSWTDFALWGGLTPGSVAQMPAMARAGAIGFKSFLCHSGLDEYPATDRHTLMEGAKVAAELGLPVAVHAEVGEPYRPDPTGTDYAAWCASRPIEMELAGIELAIEAAIFSGAAFHIVHVSSCAGIDLIHKARNEGLNLSAETCPHYLLLNDQKGSEIGATAKCAPPLRSPDQVAGLWERLEKGLIDTIGSDHSPCPPDLKSDPDFFKIWGGIAGIQHGLPLLVSQSTAIQDLTSQAVAERFKLATKGGLRLGVDADFIVLDAGSYPIKDDTPLTRHHHSPYIAMTASYQVKSTFLRGEAITSAGRGRFLQPNP